MQKPNQLFVTICQLSLACNVILTEIHNLIFYIFLTPAETKVVSAGYTWRSLAIMWSKVFVGILVVNIVTLAIWLALTESDSNGGGEVGKEGCLHVEQVIF